jgi:hypothetical protein
VKEVIVLAGGQAVKDLRRQLGDSDPGTHRA